MGMAQATLTGHGVACLQQQFDGGLPGQQFLRQQRFVGVHGDGQGTSFLSVTSSINPATYGQSVTLTAQVSVAIPAGTDAHGVPDLYAGTMLIGSGSPVSLGQTTISTSSLSVGRRQHHRQFTEGTATTRPALRLP